MAGMRHEARGAAREPGGYAETLYRRRTTWTSVDDPAVIAIDVGFAYNFTSSCETMHLVRYCILIFLYKSMIY